MPRKDHTHITVLLDSSASMWSRQLETIGGFNNFLTDQRKIAGTCSMDLIYFDIPADFNLFEPLGQPRLRDHNLQYKFVDQDVQAVELLSASTYIPDGGSTALNDATCHAIDQLGARLEALPEEQRPARVMFVILTDGLENSSRQFSMDDAKNRREHQEKVYNWKVIYLAATPQAHLSLSARNAQGLGDAVYAATSSVDEGFIVASSAAFDFRTRGVVESDLNTYVEAAKKRLDPERLP